MSVVVEVEQCNVEQQKVFPSCHFAKRFTQNPARSHLAFKTMSYVEDGSFPQQITGYLAAQASNGVDTTFQYDGSALVTPEGHAPLKPTSLRRPHWGKEVLESLQRTKDTLEAMKTCGVNVQTAHELSWLTEELPFLKRSHAKLAIKDDRAWILNTNLTQAHEEYPGLAVEVTNEQVVEKLGQFFTRQDLWAPAMNPVEMCGGGFRLYYDSGKFGQSPIYNEAKELVDIGASRFVTCSPYLPTGSYLDSLVQAAKQGSEVVVVTSAVDTTQKWYSPFKLLESYFDEETAGVKNMHLVRAPGLLAARGLFSEHRFLTGSHTLVPWGMLFGGTEEIAAEISDPVYVDQANHEIDSILTICH